MAVVSAGIKSILHIARTLEYLVSLIHPTHRSHTGIPGESILHITRMLEYLVSLIHSAHRSHAAIPGESDPFCTSLAIPGESILHITRTLEYLVSLIHSTHRSHSGIPGESARFHLHCIFANLCQSLCFLLQETEGVCVVTFGPNTDFPAFFTPRSGHSAPYNVHTPEAAADIVGM